MLSHNMSSENNYIYIYFIERGNGNNILQLLGFIL